MKLLKTNGIVIKKVDHSEADRFLTLFTKNFGKINININGIRKSKKRHLNGADLFSISNFIFYKKGDYYILSSFELNETFYNIRNDLEKLDVSFHILEILNEFLIEGETRTNLYNLLIKSLRFLDKNKNSMKNYLILSYFLTKLIYEEGIMFNISSGLYFNIEDSSTCLEKTPYKFTNLEKEILILLFKEDINSIIELNPNIRDIKNIISLLEKYINYHLNININLNPIF